MSFEALLLFGSRAREDHSPSSDVDLLAVTDDQNLKSERKSSVSLYYYSKGWLAEKAASGDLFLWHIISEASVIHDPSNVLVGLRTRFRFKPNYDAQIANASDVGWMLYRLANQMNERAACRWLAWSVRTISIGQAANMKHAAFSATALSTALRCSAVERLIQKKDELELGKEALYELAEFLTAFGAPKPMVAKNEFEEYLRYFEASGNEVGQSIINGFGEREPYR